MSNVVPKLYELWSTNGLKPDRSIYPTLTISFCPSPSHTLYETLTWHPTATINEAALGSSAAKI